MSTDWRDHLITTPDAIRRVLNAMRRVAVLGIKTENQADQAAFYVPQYLVDAGLDMIPVPVYYPDVSTILGRPVYRRLVDIPGAIDLVDVFRRPDDIPQHLADMLAAKPKTVWMQLGIHNAAVAETLAKAGIDVVQNRCLMVDHRHYVG